MICSVATRSSAVVRDELVHPTNRRMYERILVVISHKYIDPSLKREYELSDRKTYDCIAWPVASLASRWGPISLSIDREAGRAISLKVNLRGSGARICDATEMRLGRVRGGRGACHTCTWRRHEQQRQCGGSQLEEEDRQPVVEQRQVDG